MYVMYVIKIINNYFLFFLQKQYYCSLIFSLLGKVTLSTQRPSHDLHPNSLISLIFPIRRMCKYAQPTNHNLLHFHSLVFLKTWAAAKSGILSSVVASLTRFKVLFLRRWRKQVSVIRLMYNKGFDIIFIVISIKIHLFHIVRSL